MKTRKHFPAIRKHSRSASPMKNLWFYTEDKSLEQSSVSELDFNSNDRSTILRNDYTYNASGKFIVSGTKKECSFVVDWQLEDNF